MFLSIDIGGSFTRIAISKDGKSIEKKLKYETPKKYDDGIDLLIEKIEELTESKAPKAITIAAASPIDYEKGTMLKPPNLPNYKGHSIRKELELRLRTKVYLENDGAIGALGEASKRKRSKILGYITLSTGIGGARIVAEKIDYHAQPFEPGHQILDPNGRFWPGCGQKGCFEALCSGTAFALTYGVKPEFCEDDRIWEEHAEITSQGLANVITLWTPDILVIGGSLVKAGPKFTKPLIAKTKEKITLYKCPKIEISKMEDENVLLGGLIYQTQKSHLIS
jgi:glucokinase